MIKTEHIFNLPDLGEGLTSGEISECHVAVGDTVVADQIALVIETAKAAIELPMPFGGEIVAIHGEQGDMIEVGMPLITLLTDEAPAVAERKPEAVTHLVGQASTHGKQEACGASLAERIAKKTGAGRGGRVLPAVRRLARELDVDLSAVSGTGRGGAISEADVRAAAGEGAV